jgi:hypothetical protein
VEASGSVLRDQGLRRKRKTRTVVRVPVATLDSSGLELEYPTPTASRKHTARPAMLLVAASARGVLRRSVGTSEILKQKECEFLRMVSDQIH